MGPWPCFQKDRGALRASHLPGTDRHVPFCDHPFCAGTGHHTDGSHYDGLRDDTCEGNEYQSGYAGGHHLLAQMGSSADPVEWVTAITMVSNTAGISPLSTGGALALAAYSAEGGLKDGELDRLFLRMFFISAAGVVALSVLAYFGLYRWLL